MPAIAHQNKILGNTSGGGSTILVTTSESTLYGQTVTLSDGTTTLTGTFSNAGECEFTGVMMVGTLTAASGTASTSINVPYFGVYSIILSLFSATITATYPEDKGATCTCTGNGESYTASGSPYTFTVHGAGEYRVTATLDGKSITDVIQITTDGQSETATINFGTIVVTYDNAFRGLPITCTKDSSVYTKTAPSSGNTMYFYPNITGNWVISGTVSGTSYSKTANVTSLSTSVSVSLETVPDGKTTTPTDDIEKWLQCGQITGKSYTTLAEVLDDAETYERLLSDSNACDYMKRSTTWALNSGEVPVMTSDTTPSGVCSASSVYGGREAYMAFDGDDTTSWTGNTTTATLKYEFPQAVTITRVKLYVASNNQTVVVEGSNDDSTYTPLVSSFTLVAGSDVYKEVENPASYKYYRLTVTALAGQFAWLHTVQLYSADITTSQDAMMRLGKYDYACDALLADSTWCTAICGSTYFEYVLCDKVPTMTSDTTPDGECIASGYNNVQYKYLAFDNDTSTGWYAETTNASAHPWIGYVFDEPVAISKVKWSHKPANYGSSYHFDYGFFIQYSDDNGTTWNTVHSENASIIANGTLQTVEMEFVATSAHRYWRLYRDSFSTNWSESTIRFGAYVLQFYGRHTAQTDIIVTAHGGDTVYYMENGSPVTLTTADRDTGIGTVDWSDLPKGAITLYSSTAKNPSDLTADYSKTVYVTEYTTQIYLMPDNALYWYGWESSDLEDMSSANGWSFSTNGIVAPTHNTYSIRLTSSNNAFGGVGSKTAISCTTAKSIVKGVTLSAVYTDLCWTDTKSLNRNNVASATTDSLQLLTLAVNGTKYISQWEYGGRAADLYALWYEQEVINELRKRDKRPKETGQAVE